MPMYRKEYILNTFPFTSEMETFCNEMTWMVINSTFIIKTIVYFCIAPILQPAKKRMPVSTNLQTIMRSVLFVIKNVSLV